jgi:hypothetical protein
MAVQIFALTLAGIGQIETAIDDQQSSGGAPGETRRHR